MGIGEAGVAFNSDGTFFASDADVNQLYTVDLISGSKTLVGDLVDSITGDPVRVINNLQFDPDTGKFLAIGGAIPKILYGIDPLTAVATKIAELTPIVQTACAIARAPDTGEWFSVKRSTNELIKIDIVTGDVTVVGPLGPASSGNVCGLTFDEVQSMRCQNRICLESQD